MPYQDVFDLFWKEVTESAKAGTFAKLTMAKTVGKIDFRNIFVRPVSSEDGFRVLLKLRYRDREREDKENEYTLEEAYEILKSHLKNPFSTVLLFSTSKDVTYKINKKGAASISEGSPTFHDVTLAEID